MNNEEIRKKEEIKSALEAMINGDFLQTSKHLLAVLCYRSERTAELPGTAADFIQRFPAREQKHRDRSRIRRQRGIGKVGVSGWER